MSKLHPNQAYWANRWADQMHYPYWKDRCETEMEKEGYGARELFYQGTKAYKKADFPAAVQKYQDGLKLWDDLLKRHPSFRDDDLSKKDTGLIVKRYARACLQLGIDMPKDTPFVELLPYVENDNTVDPFDALEMISRNAAPTGGAAQGQGQPQPQPRP
jgi:hypothetical protein